MRVRNLVLFICTGNFYRSRFAEAVFNHHAEQRGLAWKAFSRGLAIHQAAGDLSPLTHAALAARDISLRHTGTGRVSLTEHDLERAQRRIALDEDEHYRMMQSQFPRWAGRVEYWQVMDVALRLPESALPEIESRVLSLVEELSR